MKILVALLLMTAISHDAMAKKKPPYHATLERVRTVNSGVDCTTTPNGDSAQTHCDNSFDTLYYILAEGTHEIVLRPELSLGQQWMGVASGQYLAYARPKDMLSRETVGSELLFEFVSRHDVRIIIGKGKERYRIILIDGKPIVD